MKTLFIIVFILSIASVSFSDELDIPFSCWPVELQQAFLKYGKKMDLNSDERTDDSFGYILNKGSKYVIYTYHSVSPEDFEIIKKVTFEVELAKGK